MNIPVSLLRCRWWIQTAVLTGLCLLPWVNALGWHGVMGNFYAVYLGGVPFADPMTVAQSLVVGVAPAWRLWLGAGLALALALTLGLVFCGWVCPYGLLSEWLWRLRGRVQARRRKQTAFTARTVLTLLGLLGTALLGVPLLNALSGPGLLSLAPQLWHGGHEGGQALFAVLVVPGVLLLTEALAGQRWWCRYACPQSLLLMLAAALGHRCGRGWAVLWRASACTCKDGNQPCARACSLGLRPRAPRGVDGPPAAHCVLCGDCVCACAEQGGALGIGTVSSFARSP